VYRLSGVMSFPFVTELCTASPVVRILLWIIVFILPFGHGMPEIFKHQKFEILHIFFEVKCLMCIDG
jgi:hypothetical protein